MYIDFESTYMNADIWLNGLPGLPSLWYTEFGFDISDKIITDPTFGGDFSEAKY